MEFGEGGADLAGGDEAEGRVGEAARKEGLAPAEGHGADLDDDLVEESSVIELAGEVTASDDPDVFGASGGLHGGVDGTDVALNDADVGSGD